MLTRSALCLVPSSRAPPARQVPLVVAPAAAAAAALVPVPATGQHQFSQYPVSSDKLRSNIPGKKATDACRNSDTVQPPWKDTT